MEEMEGVTKVLLVVHRLITVKVNMCGYLDIEVAAGDSSKEETGDANGGVLGDEDEGTSMFNYLIPTPMELGPF